MSLSAAEILALIDARAAGDADFALLVAQRMDSQITEALNVGRVRLVPTEVGAGTILATLGAGGGEFLDSLVAIGAANRDVYWTMDLIKQGRLRIDLAATRDGMIALAAAVPALQDSVTLLLTLGYAPDPLASDDVSNALNARARGDA